MSKKALGQKTDEKLLNLGEVAFCVTHIGIAEARTNLPRILKHVAAGEVFPLQDAKRPASPAALLLSRAKLATALTRQKPQRTLLELIESLPLRGSLEAISRVEMPDDFTPNVDRAKQGRFFLTGLIPFARYREALKDVNS
ncbi:hypothetical protein CTP10_R52910 [Cupriavidus sp. P-10]|uniref:hypothetical protein n=1 Tax=Cupriavidus sp. P-10 TaxID=2027911 RepID=UPI0011C14624|nr:hypothetical protein [Cupriavidus sp. P-10]BDB27880.1 hypothetical protein CTP10_R52910 [Cupriavidus sp. P-10]